MNSDESKSKPKGLVSLWMLVLLVLVFGAEGPLSPSAEAAGPLVLAFYYAWFDMGTWGSGQLPDLPAQQYSSADPATIARHVSQAQGAGIDAFVQSWYGPGGGNQTEGNFQTLLNTAAASGFRAAVDFEVGSPYFANPQDRIAALQYVLSTHANHPAYLRVDGKPVIFFWASWLLSVDEWTNIRSQVDPGHNSIWIVEGNSLDYLPVFDGLHLYNIAWSDNPAGTLLYWGGQVRDRAALLGVYKYWAATVMPGWDDTHIPGRSGAFVRDRAGGAYYQQCWSGAASSSPDMVIITSFNEWLEGSMIEPSVSYGDFYLNQTAQLAAAYKSGSVPAPPPILTEPVGPTESPASSTPVSPVDNPELSPSPISTVPPPSSPTPWPDGSIGHIVESGDSLIAISMRYGVTIEDLLALNGLDRDTILLIGQRLVVGVEVPDPTRELPAPPSSPKLTEVPAGTPVAETGAAAGEQAGSEGSMVEELWEPNVVIVIPPTITPQPSLAPGPTSTPQGEPGGGADRPAQPALPCIGRLFLLPAAIVIARRQSKLG